MGGWDAYRGSRKGGPWHPHLESRLGGGVGSSPRIDWWMTDRDDHHTSRVQHTAGVFADHKRSRQGLCIERVVCGGASGVGHASLSMMSAAICAQFRRPTTVCMTRAGKSRLGLYIHCTQVLYEEHWNRRPQRQATEAEQSGDP